MHPISTGQTASAVVCDLVKISAPGMASSFSLPTRTGLGWSGEPALPTDESDFIDEQLAFADSTKFSQSQYGL